MKFLNGFEIGWECLVIGFTIVCWVGIGILLLIRNLIKKLEKNVFEEDDEVFLEKHFFDNIWCS